MTKNCSPDSDEFEISLFGPGFGEGLAIHYGNNNWITVDSCIDPMDNESVILKYLKRIKTEPEKNVKYIFATHWHDDHIRGLSQIVNDCKSAEFVCSAAFLNEEFIAFIKTYDEYYTSEDTGVNEFNKVFNILHSRNSVIMRAYVDRIIFQDTINFSGNDYKFILSTLSPSDEDFNLSLRNLKNLIKEVNGPTRRAVSISPNTTSIVLNLRISKINAILGADLENLNDDKRGWKAILARSTTLNKEVDYFKVSHHGSSNGFNDVFWNDYLLVDSTCTLTPFRLGRHNLPEREIIKKICSVTSNAFTTNLNISRIKRDNTIEKIIKDVVGETLKIKPYSTGHIRCRKKINSTSASWKVELINKAGKLCG